MRESQMQTIYPVLYYDSILYWLHCQTDKIAHLSCNFIQFVRNISGRHLNLAVEIDKKKHARKLFTSLFMLRYISEF